MDEKDLFAFKGIGTEILKLIQVHFGGAFTKWMER